MTRCDFATRFIVTGLLAAGLAGTAGAAEIKIAAPGSPPMFQQNGTGREAEIIARTLALCGDTVSFRVLPRGRHLEEYRDNETIDAVATVAPGVPAPGFRSVTYIQYQNGASVLKASGLKVTSLADLKGKRAVTFQGGKDILPGLKDAAPGFAGLEEKSDQLAHSKLLFAGRVDVVLSDGLIFAEYNRQLREKRGEVDFDPAQEVVFTAIFPPTDYSLMFRKEVPRDNFNRCFGELSKTDAIDKINKAAIEPYRATVGKQYLNY